MSGEKRPDGQRRQTTTDIARKVGVSVATVSRVFNTPELVAEETRRAVLEAADEFGFRPNLAARSLRTGRSDSIAFALRTKHLIGEFYSEFLAGCHGELAGARIHPILSVIPESESPLDWIRELVFGGSFSRLAIHFELVEEPEALRALNLPVTLFNYCPSESSKLRDFSSVGYDNAMGTAEAVRHLARLGHRRIAHLTGNRGNQDSAARLKGFRQAMKEASLPVEEKWIVECLFEAGPQSGAGALDRLLSAKGPPPTALVCQSDNIAMGAISAARRWGLSLPQDLSVVGFDDFLWAANYFPALTTVRHSGWDLGQALGKLLLEERENSSHGPKHVVLPTTLVVRDSTCAPRKS